MVCMTKLVGFVVIPVAMGSSAVLADSAGVDGIMAQASEGKIAKQFVHAEELYTSVFTRYPTSQAAPQPMFDLAECYASAGNVVDGIKAFDNPAQQYPKSNQAIFALMRMGSLDTSLCVAATKPEEKNRYKSDAEAAFQRIVSSYPTNRKACAEADLARVTALRELASCNDESWDRVESEANKLLPEYLFLNGLDLAE